MLRDLENHKIAPLYAPNKHLVALGSSGCGKTFLAVRDTLHRIRDGDKAIILDVSGSYTKDELAQSGNVFGNHICYHQANEDKFEFPVFPEDVSGALVDALVEAFGIGSYNQETILAECCDELLEGTGGFTFMRLFNKLEERQREYLTEGCDGLPDTLKNTGYLLNKFRSVRKLDNITFLGQQKYERKKERKEPVTILQLSNLSEKQKRMLSVFMLSLLWTNAKHRGKHRESDGYDVVLLDEFQHFPMDDESSIVSILREGRKNNFSAILCSQYLSDRKESELSALTQAGTVLLFRSTKNEVKMLIDLFCLGEQTWKRILPELDVGDAVLIGSYRLENGRILNRPVIVNVEDKVESLDMPEHHDSLVEVHAPDSKQVQDEAETSETEQSEEDNLASQDETENTTQKRGFGRGTVIYR